MPSNLSELENIVEEKEKEDLATPHKRDGQYRSIDNAFSAAVEHVHK